MPGWRRRPASRRGGTSTRCCSAPTGAWRAPGAPRPRRWRARSPGRSRRCLRPDPGARGAGALPHPVMLGHDIYRGSSYGAWHPLRIPRVSTVMDLARALGWLPRERFRRSPRAKARALEVFHTRAYLAALEAAEAEGWVSDAVRDRHRIGTTANPVF